ncbi:MAG: hypothetical protein AB1742_08360 [bacterium]
MDDMKTRLEKMIGGYDAEHDRILRRAMFFFGRRLRTMNNPLGRFIVSKVTTRLLASAIVKWKLFGVEKRDGMSLEEITLNWLKPSIFFRIPTEIGAVSDDRIEVLRPECTVGFDEPALCLICRASMNMDMEIVRRLGGKLTVTETILEGAPKCRHVIEKA